MRTKMIIVQGIANEQSIAYAFADYARKILGPDKITLITHPKIVNKVASFCTPYITTNSVIGWDALSGEELQITTDDGVPNKLFHSVAHGGPTCLQDDWRKWEHKDLDMMMDVSVWSLLPVARAIPNLKSVVTVSYLGARRAVVGYGAMGVAKAALEAVVRTMSQTGVVANAICPGPVKMRASSGIKDFVEIENRYLKLVKYAEGDVIKGDTARLAYTLLTSDTIRGQVIDIDCGYSV